MTHTSAIETTDDGTNGRTARLTSARNLTALKRKPSPQNLWVVSSRLLRLSIPQKSLDAVAGHWTQGCEAVAFMIQLPDGA